MNFLLHRLLLAGGFLLALTIQSLSQVSFNLKVFLEGPFNGAEMITDLYQKGMIPLTQPYNTNPWNYDGTEAVASIPNPDIIDWVLLELRETNGGAASATPSAMIHRQAAFVLKGGAIVDLDGLSMISYSGSISSDLYVIIWHRNHLAVMSSVALSDIGGIYSWDFTSILSSSYLDGHKEIATGTFGMIAGDSDGNGLINELDYSIDWSQQAGLKEYSGTDHNMDGEINNIDKDDFWYVNLGIESKIPLEIPFNCGDLISDNDGNFYNTVLLGSQCWMKENLITTTYRDGTPIPNVADNSAWSNLVTGAYALYNNDINWKDKYGILYNWYAVVDVGGLCPTGWSVPTNAEWTILTNFIGGIGPDQGNKIKSCRQVNSPEPGGCNTVIHPRWEEDAQDWGTDDYGFAGLPGGFRFNNGNFNALGSSAYWWTSTEKTAANAWLRGLGYYYGSVDVIDFYKKGGFSVRCLKD